VRKVVAIPSRTRRSFQGHCGPSRAGVSLHPRALLQPMRRRKAGTLCSDLRSRLVTGESLQGWKREKPSARAERERLGRILKQAFPLGESGSFTGVLEAIRTPFDEPAGAASQTGRDEGCDAVALARSPPDR